MNTQSTTSLKVDGMGCPSCVQHIEETLGGLPGVGAVEVQLREGRVSVKHDDSIAGEALMAALETAGYRSSPSDAT
jgi:copper chaperone CopZ